MVSSFLANKMKSQKLILGVREMGRENYEMSEKVLELDGKLKMIQRG